MNKDSEQDIETKDLMGTVVYV